MVNGHGKQAPKLEPAIQRAIEVDQAKEALGRLIGQWDQLALAQRKLLPGLANALATMAAAPLNLTGVQQDPASGQVTAISYRTMDGVDHMLTIERPQTPPASRLIVPQ